MKTLLATLLLALSLGAQAQNSIIDESDFKPKKKTVRTAPADDEEEPKKFDPSKLVFGGNIGATFGDFTFINLSPQVGYAFKPWITAGAGINYLYNSVRFRNFNGDEVQRDNLSFAGLNLFTRVFPVKFIMLSVQPELNYSWGRTRYKVGNLPDQKLEGAFVPVFMVGAGVVVPSGGRGGMFISLQYDVVQNQRSPYGNRPFVNIGFTL
ncbi:MAG: hypothetical protein EAY75_15860 [Bacteroidetes bacterium]|nr:MAG: hypothetical protein EAY75_15860 [Bacteroidota bacterium]